MNIKIGDQIPGLYPSTFTSQEIEEDKQLRRYAVVRFVFDSGSFCEAFSLRGCEL